MPARIPPQNIVILCIPPIDLFNVEGPMEAFRLANRLANKNPLIKLNWFPPGRIWLSKARPALTCKPTTRCPMRDGKMPKSIR
ncbi:hypothetical protein SODG_003305 [Sodalis praecaptivus]